jgi:hypothetical protein
MAFQLPNGWSASIEAEKAEALFEAHYTYDPGAGVFVRYVSPRKIFSVAWVTNHSVSALQRAILSKAADAELYFDDPSAASIYDGLIRRYGWGPIEVALRTRDRDPDPTLRSAATAHFDDLVPVRGAVRRATCLGVYLDMKDRYIFLPRELTEIPAQPLMLDETTTFRVPRWFAKQEGLPE